MKRFLVIAALLLATSIAFADDDDETKPSELPCPPGCMPIPPGQPSHPIARPPGVPTQPIYLPPVPTHPIVIQPGVPVHPIVIPPDSDLKPTHPISRPDLKPTNPIARPDLKPTQPIYLPGEPSHPIAPAPEGDHHVWVGGDCIVSGDEMMYAKVDAYLKSGVSSGAAEFLFVQSGLWIRVEVDCVDLEGNRAWLGGPIVASNGPITNGSRVMWSCIDNGESAAYADLTSEPVGATANSCVDRPATTMFQWTHGNIDIK